jgi:dienelactone hydrolase
LSQPTYEVRRFRFEVLPGLDTYAVELIPKSVASRAAVLLQHGYGVTPELACGLTPSANLGDYSYRSLGIHLAMRGYRVLAVHHPSGYGTPDESCGSIPGHEPLGRTYGKNRLHRMALMAGGTLFGLDMMACSRGVDYLSQSGGVNPDRIGMYGKSQGGQSALYLAAIDQRIRAAVCSAYFNTRTLKLIGPHRATSYLDSAEEDKFFTDVIRTFSDADIVSLIVPRAFAVEAGIKDTSVDFEKSKAEFGRAARHYRQLGIGDQIQFIQHSEGHMAGTKRALSFLDQVLQP